MFNFSLISIRQITINLMFPVRVGSLMYCWPFARKNFVRLQPEIALLIGSIVERFERMEDAKKRRNSRKLGVLCKKLRRFGVQIPTNEFGEPVSTESNEDVLRWGLHLIDIRECIRDGMHLSDIRKLRVGERPDSHDKTYLCFLFGFHEENVEAY